ncbi:MAG: hypothetical protein PGN29_04515 [Gordonia paraffinivorans]
MDVDAVSAALLRTAIRDQQASRRMDPGDPVAELRATVRALARAGGVRIRTGMVDDVLVVVRADADVWHESASQMREKLVPPRPPTSTRGA